MEQIKVGHVEIDDSDEQHPVALIHVGGRPMDMLEIAVLLRDLGAAMVEAEQELDIARKDAEIERLRAQPS